MKLLHFYSVRVLEVVVKVDQEVRKDLVSDKPVIVEGHVKISKEQRSWFAMLSSNDCKISKKL